MPDAHELFASLRLAVRSLLGTGTLSDAAPLLPLMPGLQAQLLSEVAPKLANDALVPLATALVFLTNDDCPSVVVAWLCTLYAGRT